MNIAHMNRKREFFLYSFSFLIVTYTKGNLLFLGRGGCHWHWFITVPSANRLLACFQLLLRSLSRCIIYTVFIALPWSLGSQYKYIFFSSISTLHTCDWVRFPAGDLRGLVTHDVCCSMCYTECILFFLTTFPSASACSIGGLNFSMMEWWR